MSRTVSPLRVLGLAAVLVLSAGAAVAGQSPAPAFDEEAAKAYCADNGGTVQHRRAAWNTNSDQAAWLWLDGDIDLCRFQTLLPDDESRIYIDLRTLTTPEATLAAVAYLSKIPLPETQGGANPASVHCANLGGSSSFGNGMNGGGWVNLDDPIDIIAAMCVFPDGSMIDEWGIAYYTADAVRGIDLAPILGYQPGDRLPAMFYPAE